MIPHKRHALIILIAVFQFGCGGNQLFRDEIDTNGDAEVDLVRYFKGVQLIKTESLEAQGPPEIAPRMFYYKAPVMVEIGGEIYLQQEVDLGRTFGRRATAITGRSFIYIKDRNIVFSKSLFANGKIDTLVLERPSGGTERIFENFDMDDNFDMFTLYDRHQKPRMAKISLPTSTSIGELRKYMPPPDAPGPEIEDPATGKWFIRYDFRDQNKLVPGPADSK